MTTDFDSERLAGQALERRGMPRGGPELQFRVAGRAELQQVVVAPIVKFEIRDRLRVAAIEAFGQTQDRGERADHASIAPAEMTELFVLALRRRLAVIPRDERDDVDLVRLEAAQIAVLDQIVRVFVVSFIADVDAHIVQDRPVLEVFALAIGQPVDRAGVVEERGRETCDLLRVLRPVVAALGKLEDAAAADVGIAIGLGDLFAVPRDVIEHESFAQRQIAQRDLLGAEAAQNFVEQNRSCDGEVGAPRLECSDAQPLLEIQRHEACALRAARSDRS